MSVVLEKGVADGDGDCVLTASELQDVNMIAKTRKMDCFLIRTPSGVFQRQLPNYILRCPLC